MVDHLAGDRNDAPKCVRYQMTWPSLCRLGSSPSWVSITPLSYLAFCLLWLPR